MWSLYNWFYDDVTIGENITGPGRNMPDMAILLKERKLSLKSPVIIEELKQMCQLTEVMLAKKNLKHIVAPPRITTFPCINPIFKELRIKSRKMQLS
jgi:hypothetical protein